MITPISVIFASTPEGIIGLKGSYPLLWHKPADLKRFQEVTQYSNLLMGRHTFESFGGKTLPNRKMFTISSSSLQGPNLEQAIKNVQDIEGKFSRIFLIGGAGLITEAFEKNLVREVFHTEIFVGGYPNVNHDDFAIIPQWILDNIKNQSHSIEEAQSGEVFRHAYISS